MTPPTPVSKSLAVEADEDIAAQEAFEALVARLNRQSVDKHYDAYEDIDWDAPEMRIDADDPAWIISTEDALGETAWYQSLPPHVQSRIGLQRVASMMKIGVEFENVLKRGLLEFAGTLPNGSPLFRYAYHETIEEAQHSLMFQEFVNRSGLDIPGLPARMQHGARVITLLGRLFPELFFVFVLGGEDPIDYVQRRELQRGSGLHPLLERIVRIHVTEEARHLSFARHYLKLNVPELGFARKSALTVGAPLILGVMVELMLRPSRKFIREYDIPEDVVRQVYTKNPEHLAETRRSLQKVRRLLDELGLITPASKPIWKAFKIWDPELDNR